METPGPEETATPPVKEEPEEVKQERTLRESPQYKRDMYADFDRIEQRGKSLKQKRPGIFKLPERPIERTPPRSTDAPTQEPLPKPRPEAVTEEDVPHPQWTPLTRREQNRAEEELLEYKRKLDKGFREGILTKEECLSKVREKEIELGLRPPIENS